MTSTSGTGCFVRHFQIASLWIVSIVRILFYAVRTKGQEKFVQKALMVLEFESGANAKRVRSAAGGRITVVVDTGEASSGFSDLVHQPVPL